MRSHTSKDATLQEKKVYDRLTKWKADVFKTEADDVPSQVAGMRFILRSNPTCLQKFDTFLLHDKAAKSDAATAQVNAMLLEGYAHSQEPEFEGRKKWPCGAEGTDTHKIYKVMRHFFKDAGRSTHARREEFLKGMKTKWPERAVWWRQNFTVSDEGDAEEEEDEDEE